MSKWQEYKEKNNGITPLSIISASTEWLDKEGANPRVDICRVCPELIQLTKQCKRCSCFMAIKARIESAVCPLGKW